jgi:hypothetical protein
VVDSQVQGSGAVDVLIRFYDTPFGHSLCLAVENGFLQGVSLQHVRLPTSIILREVSLCRRGKRPDSWLKDIVFLPELLSPEHTSRVYRHPDQLLQFKASSSSHVPRPGPKGKNISFVSMYNIKKKNPELAMNKIDPSPSSSSQSPSSVVSENVGSAPLDTVLQKASAPPPSTATEEKKTSLNKTPCDGVCVVASNDNMEASGTEDVIETNMKQFKANMEALLAKVEPDSEDKFETPAINLIQCASNMLKHQVELRKKNDKLGRMVDDLSEYKAAAAREYDVTLHELVEVLLHDANRDAPTQEEFAAIKAAQSEEAREHLGGLISTFKNLISCAKSGQKVRTEKIQVQKATAGSGTNKRKSSGKLGALMNQFHDAVKTHEHMVDDNTNNTNNFVLGSIPGQELNIPHSLLPKVESCASQPNKKRQKTNRLISMFRNIDEKQRGETVDNAYNSFF